MVLSKWERKVLDDSLKIAELEKRIVTGEKVVTDLRKKLLDLYHFDHQGVDLQQQLADYERYIPKDPKDEYQLEWHKELLLDYLALGSMEDVARKLIAEQEHLIACKCRKRDLEKRLEQAFVKRY